MSSDLNSIYTFLTPHIYGTIGAIRIALPILAVFVLIELIRPGKRLNWKSTIFNIWYTPFFLTISSILMGIIWQFIPKGWTQGYILLQENSGLKLAALFILYLLIFDFTYYWLHRAQHTIPWLWRYHATHHADPNVSVLSTSRHHWLEEVFRFLPILLPLSVLFGSLSALPLWALVFPGLYGIFIHWNTPFRMSAISRLIVTPWFHRIHHSIKPEHHNKNYSVFFPVWDIIFGSAHFAHPKEFPETGISTKLSPNSLRRLLPIPEQ